MMVIEMGSPQEMESYRITMDSQSGKKTFASAGIIFNVSFAGFIEKKESKQFLLALSDWVDKWNESHQV